MSHCNLLITGDGVAIIQKVPLSLIRSTMMVSVHRPKVGGGRSRLGPALNPPLIQCARVATGVGLGGAEQSSDPGSIQAAD